MDAIYARQSVEKADSLSIQGQIDLCRRETAEPVRIYQDRGFSGKNTNRPAFQRLMEDVEKGLIQKIVVYRLDRFSRSIADFGRLWEILQKHHVEFVSINETFDTSTPMGRAMLNIIMVFAQLERETTAQRVRDNYYQRVKLGAWPGGPPPYGFSLGRLPGPDGSLAPGLIPNEQMAVVRRIFESYSRGGATLGSVARSLNEEHIPGPKRPVWDNVALSRILHSPLYAMADEDLCLYYKGKGLQFTAPMEAFDGVHAGMVIGKRNRSAGTYQNPGEQHFAPANHLGAIPSRLWLACQYKLDANRQLGRAGSGKHTWLSGLLKCGVCGYSVKVNRSSDRFYLVCSGRSNLGICSASIQADLPALEAGVAAELEALLAECPAIPPQRQEDQETGRALEEIDRRIDRLMEALSQGNAPTISYINRTVEKLEGQRQKLLEQQAGLPGKPGPHLNRLTFAPLDLEEKKRVAAQFIREVRLNNDEAEVYWSV